MSRGNAGTVCAAQRRLSSTRRRSTRTTTPRCSLSRTARLRAPIFRSSIPTSSTAMSMSANSRRTSCSPDSISSALKVLWARRTRGGCAGSESTRNEETSGSLSCSRFAPPFPEYRHHRNLGLRGGSTKHARKSNAKRDDCLQKLRMSKSSIYSSYPRPERCFSRFFL
jgi:hypothetical protein